MGPSTDRLERLIEKEKQLKARIQLEKNKLGASARKQRTGKLIAWGVVVEQMLADETLKVDWWKTQCERLLSGRTLERALVDELTGEKYQIMSIHPQKIIVDIDII
jgi:hypothetical protein